MGKNLIYIVAIDDSNAKVSVNDFFCYSEPTWIRYCEKYDIDLIVQTVHQFDNTFKPIWNKEMICILGKDYDKIGIVDSDTMIHWGAPNIFELFSENEFCGVNDIADLNWLFSSIDDRQKFFPEIELDISKYINAGSIFFGNKYLGIFKELLTLYKANKAEIDSIQGGGKEQTLLNFVLQKNNVPITLLPPAWNLFSIHRKNMFVHNWQLYPEFKGVDPENPKSYPHFVKCGYIWHFTGFPIEDRVNIMKTTWEIFKDRYV